MANLRGKLNQTANTIRKVFKVLHVHTPVVLTKKSGTTSHSARFMCNNLQGALHKQSTNHKLTVKVASTIW